MRGISRLISLLALFSATTATAADVIVVSSQGPSAPKLRPGTRLSDTQPISLQGSDQLVIMTTRGTRTLRGPGLIRLLDTRTPVPTQLGPGRGNAPRPRIGGVRSLDLEQATTRNLWSVNASSGDRFCVPAGKAVTLWAPFLDSDRAGAAALLTIRAESSGKVVTLGPQRFPGILWPGDLGNPVGRFTFLVAGGAPRAVELMAVEAPPGDGQNWGEQLLAQTQLLASQGCANQLNWLVTSVGEDGSAPAPSAQP